MFHDIFLSEEDSSEISFTIKKYRIRSGLSRKLCESKDGAPYVIKGPMGKGLDIQPCGVHVAFTAGTGILPFIDLVAHLIRKNLGLLTPDEDKQIDLKNFKFILYVSFSSKQDIIGYKLIKGLSMIVKRLKLDNF